MYKNIYLCLLLTTIVVQIGFKTKTQLIDYNTFENVLLFVIYSLDIIICNILANVLYLIICDSCIAYYNTSLFGVLI